MSAEGKSQLLRAAEHGELDALAALSPDHDLEATTPRGETALHIAARAGHVAFARALIERGADVDRRVGLVPSLQRGAKTALMIAATEDRSGVIRALAEAGADVTARERNGLQAVHLAAMRGHLDAVRTLVELGAHLEEHDERGRSVAALAAASRSGTELLAWCFERGVEPTQRLEGGSTFLHEACRPAPPATVQVLLEMGLSARDEDEHGTTPLLVLCSSTAPSYADEERLRSFELLVSAGADVHHANRRGTTPLHMAAAILHPQLVDRLLDLGADLDAADDAGRTPLFLAVSNGHRALARKLVERGADPRVVDARGNTLLHRAAGSWDPDWVAFVADLDVELNAVNAEGKTALDYSHAGANPACDFEDIVNMNAVESLLEKRGAKRAAELE